MTKVKAATKSSIYQELSAKTSLTRKQIASVFDELTGMIKNELSKKGPGIFNFVGLLKIKRVEKPPTKARMGVKPGTTEPMLFKAKPKRTVVKALPLKALKDFVK